MPAPSDDVLARALGGAIAGRVAVAGGDSHHAMRVTLAGRHPVFVKYGADAATYVAEAEGLRWLAAADALPTPEVLAVGDDDAPFLALAWIDEGPRAADFDERLGRGLAALHRFGAPSFGLAAPNVMGRVPQDNRACASWAAFYAERRIAPLLAAGRDAGSLGAADVRAVESVLDRLPALLGPDEPPARLHGDLWAGNVMADAHGLPVLVDPAVYGGHREIDLAMLRLFGGVGPRAFAAYDDAFPLAPGVEDRVAVHQLYPLLIHVVMFGAGWAAAVRRAATDALRR